MDLVSRLQEVQAVLEAIRGPKGQALALVGDRGSGKSSVLNAAADIDDMPVAILRGNLMETTWPLSGVSAFLAAVDDAQGSDLLAVFQRGGVPESPFHLAQELVARLRDASMGRFVVFVDDVDSLDELSQQVLGFVFRRMSATGMRAVLTMESMSFDGPFHGVSRLVMGPLEVSTLIELGRSIAPATASFPVLDCVARGSSGSPLAFKSILGELPVEVVEGVAPLPVPMRPGKKLAVLAAERHSELGSDARRSLDLLACGAYLPESVFRDLDGASLEGLEELIAGGIVARVGGDLVVRDPAACSTAYWSLQASARLKLHEVLQRACDGGYPGLHAWHASYLQLPGGVPMLLVKLLRGSSPRRVFRS